MPRVSGLFWQRPDGSVRYYSGHAPDVLSRLPPRSVQSVITSPPYWGLRSYLPDDHPLKPYEVGSEKTPQEYVEKMVHLFRAVREVLRDDGTLWLNLGDSYAQTEIRHRNGKNGTTMNCEPTDAWSVGVAQTGRRLSHGCKPKDLIGIPWMVAFALRADGWYLRSDIIWHKPSPMPESVTDRPTKAHEYLFLLTKRGGYYYDVEAIKEKSIYQPGSREERAKGSFNSKYHNYDGARPGDEAFRAVRSTKNKRSVWSVDNEQRLLSWLAENHPDALDEFLLAERNKGDVWRVAAGGGKKSSKKHYATFPPKLIEPCVLAGTSMKGACVGCGSPWRRVTQKTKIKRPRPNDFVKRTGEAGTGNSCANSVAGVAVATLGWEPTCNCGAVGVRPCVILDPFIGSGTTAFTALVHGRHCWGIDLFEEYLENDAIPRVEHYDPTE